MARHTLRKAGLKVLSVAVATMLWLVVTGDPVVERSVRIGVELMRMPTGIELVGAAPDTVTVRVRGAASRLSGLGPADLAAVVDLDAVRAGRRLFPLTPKEITAPYGVEVIQVTPPVLPMTFEATATVTVPVRPRIEGIPVPGHEVTNVSVTPSQVRIEGPESALRGLTEVFTEPVSIERATSLVREAVTIDTGESTLRLAGGASAVVTVMISADTTERTVTGVPIAVRGGPSGPTVPGEAAVTVQGAGDIVQALTAADIVLYVEAKGASAGQTLRVAAESSPRYVVRAIAPASVVLGASRPRP